MKHFFIITNENKDPDMAVTGKLIEYIKQHGGEGTSSNDSRCSRQNGMYVVPNDTDCILVLGGDGTLLQAARETIHLDIPMLGINMGTMGYLAEIELSGLENAIDLLLNNEYEVESRMMLSGIITKEHEAQQPVSALNEVAITRNGTLQMINYNIYVNGKFLKCYSGDGIILATPTGSTGYNLSAGGPIVEPKAEIILMTPICPHTINSRSILLSQTDTIEVEVASGREGQMQEVEVNFDGNHKTIIHSGDRITVTKSKETTKIIKISQLSFLEVLHRKISD